MPDLVKDFIGLNILVNDPQGDDSKDSSNDALEAGVDVSNTVGFDEDPTGYSIDAALQEQQILPILLTHRNGNWGHNTWKQIRNSNNAVVRNEKKYNKISITSDPETKKVVVGGKIETILFRDLVKKSYNEPCVVSKHHPLIVLLSREEFDDQNKRTEFLYALEASYNNEITFMTNDEVDVHAGVIPIESEDYETLKGLYLKGALEDEESPFNSFRSFIFKQTVFPPEEFTYKSYTRKRINFVSGYWRDMRENRTTRREHFSNSYYLNESTWPLDAPDDFFTRASNFSVEYDTGGVPTQLVGSGSGILQNVYGQFSTKINSTDHAKNFVPSYYYSQRNDFMANVNTFFTDISSSRDAVTASHGANFDIIGRLIASDSGPEAARQFVDLSKSLSWSWDGYRKGEAYWDTPVMANREPFDDNIDEFYNLIEKKYKDYSIIPEYKINTHIDFYLENGVKKENLDLFEVTGGNEEIKRSSDQFFYRVYSNSDFLKNFKILQKDHKEFADPSAISLTCKAVLKLIPYEGFYPAQRTAKISEQFFDSYSGSVKPDQSALMFSDSNHNGYFRHLQKPLFAPGVLFNSIKSGLGVSYPIYTISSNDTRLVTGSMSLGNTMSSQTSLDLYAIGISGSSYQGLLDYVNRIPFEALIEPEKYLSGINIYYASRDWYSTYRNHSQTDLDTSVLWSGKGDNKYKKMMNNFLAETPEFFLKHKDFVKLRSKKQDDPTFGYMETGNTYRMRFKTYKTFKSPKQPIQWDNTGSIKRYVDVPQSLNDFGITAAQENITMYSRPSAFGPPEGLVFSDYIFANSAGYLNYWTTTPPYYHGEAWTDISFTPTETKNHNISEILKDAVIEHKRYYNPKILHPVPTWVPWISNTQATLKANIDMEDLINSIALQNDSSFNLLTRERPDIDQDGDSQDQDYLVIQSKFETPILNFNHIQTSSMTLPSLGKGKVSAPIGMWHQFGNIPSNNEGIFCQITDVPISYLHSNNMRNKATGSDGLTTGNAYDEGFDWNETEINDYKEMKSQNKSLADVLGFSKQPVRLGEIAKVKKIKEAVVAVPFYETDGVKKFFEIPRKDIDNVIAGNSKLCGQTVIEMVDKMRQYNFPPSMDFLNYSEVDPFAMYIFEFEHDLTQQDLSYIWQNLAPDIALNHEEAEATVTHELLAHELLGGGAVVTTTEDGAILNESSKGIEFKEDIRWMVFKVKYRAKTNYFKKMVGKKDSIDSSRGIGPSGEDDLITYNWPYDFFSLVELVKIDASVEFSNIERDEKTKERVVKDIKPKPTTSKEREASNPRKIIKRK